MAHRVSGGRTESVALSGGVKVVPGSEPSQRCYMGSSCSMTKLRRLWTSERCDRMSHDNTAHLEANLEVVREYLVGQFKGFEITEKQDRPLAYSFTVTRSSDERYQVKVSGLQLSDIGNTPESTKRRLITDNVAGRMKGQSQGEYFSWGKP